MQTRSFAFLIGIPACALWAVTSFAQDGQDPQPNETIAHYLRLDNPSIIDNTQFLADGPSPAEQASGSNGSSENTTTTGIHGRDMNAVASTGSVPWKPSPVQGRPLLSQPVQMALSATYNDTEKDRGYNITIPGCTPANTVISDWVAPSGDVMDNCTLAQMSQKLLLPSASLFEFTTSRAASLLDKINSTLQTAVCEAPLAPPDRELKAINRRPGFRFDPDKQSAYITSLLIIQGGSLAWAFAGLHLGLIHQGITAGITLTTQALILAIFASVGGTLIVIAERERRHIGRAEAVALNAFIALGEKFYDQFAGGIQCIQEAPLRDQIQTIVGKLSQGARILVTEDVQQAAMRTAGSSSVNLVAQGADIENQLSRAQCGH